MDLPELHGYRRADGQVGARNHILVLPSVVCADQTATLIGTEPGTVAVVHQHGCGQVGDDVAHTERAFLGFATNPNVGGAVIVSLGCETIQGRRLANLIAERGQRTEFTGIQLMGGTANTVDRGREAVGRLRGQLASDHRVSVTAANLLLGLATDAPSPLAEAVAAAARTAGISVVIATPGPRPEALWPDAPTVGYGDRAPAGRSVIEHAGEGPEQHVALAGAGAQVIVSLRGPGEAPHGCATVPVVAVAGDAVMFAALADDFDLDGSQVSAAEVLALAIAVFNGQPAAAERRGAHDFVLRRIARTM